MSTAGSSWTATDSWHADYAPGRHRTDGVEAAGFSLEYELVPGCRPPITHADRSPTWLPSTTSADAALPWDPTDGGDRTTKGGPSTRMAPGGDWPLPAGEGVALLNAVSIPPPAGPRRRFDGVLIVDLGAATASWNPTGNSVNGERHDVNLVATHNAHFTPGVTSEPRQ
jgi:hypothetical protein